MNGFIYVIIIYDWDVDYFYHNIPGHRYRNPMVFPGPASPHNMAKPAFLYKAFALFYEDQPFKYDCYLMPNEAMAPTDPKDFRVSLDTLNRMTGFAFLGNVPVELTSPMDENNFIATYLRNLEAPAPANDQPSASYPIIDIYSDSDDDAFKAPPAKHVKLGD